MVSKIERRAFLRGGLALGVGAVAWACSRGTGDDGTQATPSPSGTNATAGGIQVLAGARMLSIGDTRQSFVILEDNKPFKPDSMKVFLSGAGLDAFEVEASHQQITRGLGGDDGHDHTHAPGTEVEDIFVVRHDFDREGVWDIEVEIDGETYSAPFQIVEDTPWPSVGDEAIASESATTDDAQDVDPICTRDPVCSMHEMSIADALDDGKPLIISFATPRFCTSRACGPVVDLIETEKERVGDACNFVHVEVWANDEDAVGKEPAAAFTEWKLDTEPWTYFIGADGKVKERWLGPVGADELTKAVDALLA
jgi:hypothetical protein